MQRNERVIEAYLGTHVGTPGDGATAAAKA